jgi:Lrp/AsnC family leucine-responsive transcriptional regulator
VKAKKRPLTSTSNDIRSDIERATLMDDFDRSLLSRLQADAQSKYADLGAAVHLSAPAVFGRVQKLRKAGVIRRFTIDIDPAALGLTVCAFVTVKLNSTGCSAVAGALAAFPEVEECHTTGGASDILIKVRVKSPKDLEALLAKVGATPGVSATQTTIVLDTYVERGLRRESPELAPSVPAEPSA